MSRRYFGARLVRTGQERTTLGQAYALRYELRRLEARAAVIREKLHLLALQRALIREQDVDEAMRRGGRKRR